jgi:hypothetical protein
MTSDGVFPSRLGLGTLFITSSECLITADGVFPSILGLVNRLSGGLFRSRLPNETSALIVAMNRPNGDSLLLKRIELGRRVTSSTIEIC